MLTKIKSSRVCIRLAKLILGKGRIWINASFSPFFPCFLKDTILLNLKKEHHSRKKSNLCVSLLNLEVFSWQGITGNIFWWKVPRTAARGSLLTYGFGLFLLPKNNEYIYREKNYALEMKMDKNPPIFPGKLLILVGLSQIIKTKWNKVHWLGKTRQKTLGKEYPEEQQLKENLFTVKLIH